MPLTSYEIINSLEEIEFIAGTNYILTFLVNDQNGSPISLSSGSAKWTLCPYGQTDFPVLTKDGVIDLVITNKFTVTLLSADTASLSGKYIQQPIAIDFSGQQYRPAQGVVTIAPKINNP
jgi:hypothetical protein